MNVWNEQAKLSLITFSVIIIHVSNENINSTKILNLRKHLKGIRKKRIGVNIFLRCFILFFFTNSPTAYC